MIKKFKNNKGFTLVEILVAVGLFALIATFSLGAVMSIFDANRKAQSSKTVVDNLNITIENMARTIRFGDHYYCGASSNPNVAIDCISADGSTDLSVTFNGKRIIYALSNGSIVRSDDGGVSNVSITSSDTVIERLRFFVFNTDPGPADTNQPYVKAVIKGYAGSKSTNRTDFSIETLISQRALDL